MKRLHKSDHDRMFCGVCGGIAAYLNIDPTLVRVVWVLLTFASFGCGLLAYLIAAVLMPTAAKARELEYRDAC